MDDVGAEPGLDGVVPAERLRAGVGGEEQIAALDQPEVGALAVDFEQVAGAAEEIDGVEREADIDRRRELLADAAAGQRRRGAGEGRVALDEEHTAVERRIGSEVIRHRRAVRRPADDDDVV